MMTSGMISGSADITAATPSRGWAMSKASRMPSVASTWVEKAGPPPETKVDRVEVAEREDRREQRADQIEVGEQREGDMDEACGTRWRRRPCAASLDVLGDRHPAGEQDHGPERQPLPDIATRSPSPSPASARSSQAGPSMPKRSYSSVVDEAPLAVEHPVDRDEGRQGRHRPGQHEDHQQPLDPPALAHEEARQQQRQEQLHVHADDRGRATC